MTYFRAISQSPQALHMSRSSFAAATRSSKSSCSSPTERTGEPKRRRANPIDHFRHQSASRLSRDPSTSNPMIIPQRDGIRDLPRLPVSRSCVWNCTKPDRAKCVTKPKRVSGELSRYFYGQRSPSKIAVNQIIPTAQASGAATHRISAARSNMGSRHV
jgi:hypothetical protein